MTPQKFTGVATTGPTLKILAIYLHRASTLSIVVWEPIRRFVCIVGGDAEMQQPGDPIRKAERGERPDTCLHCVLMTALEEWFERHGTLDHGKVVVDVLHAVQKLNEVSAELIEHVPDRSGRRRAARFAHDTLDATIKSLRTGKLQAVEAPPEH
jgi:hypothetical protein